MKSFETTRTLQGRVEIGRQSPRHCRVEPITIKEPYKPDVKEFDDTDEFTRYFRGHEDQFKEPNSDPEKEPRFLTANKLNRTYKIPGYRIRIIRKGTDNEELTLVKDYHGRSSEDGSSNDSIENSSIEELLQWRQQAAEISAELRQQVSELMDRVNNIETFLLQLKR